MIHFGFYSALGRFAYPFRYREVYGHMAELGMTTGTVEGGYAQLCPQEPQVGMVLQVEAMMDAGLARPGEPMLFIADTDVIRAAMRAKERKLKESLPVAESNPRLIYDAMQRSNRLPWPAPVLHIADDPAPVAGMLDWLARERLKAHNCHFQVGGNLAGYFLMEAKTVREGEPPQTLGEQLDVWIVTAKTWQQDTAKNARAFGKRLWALHTDGSTGSYERMRYLGLWAWANGPEQVLVWSWTHTAETMVRCDGSLCVPKDDHHTYAIPSPDGWHDTPGLLGYAQGVKDCRAIEAAEQAGLPAVTAYLADLRRSVPFAFPREGRPLPAPEVRGEAVVAQLEKLARQGRKRGG
jgi:hypothetical protein